MAVSTQHLQELASRLSGRLEWNDLYVKMYATDASIYRQEPLAVAFPKTKKDIQELIFFALKQKTSLIPRTAGTSLAGQCVGDGIVVDVSRYFTEIIELNTEEQWVKVQPGVVRDELNTYLAEHDLFFGPNTSTANRCMMGGMVGNNSSGTTSIKYGVTRDKVLELEVLLSDGSEAVFTAGNVLEKDSLASKISDEIETLLNEPGAKASIKNNFPKKEIHRRNTGYALDVLAEQDQLDLTKLLAGSEGTLAFTTAIKLHVDKLPPEYVALVCAHFNSIHTSMEAVLVAMQSKPYACELMDKVILDCTKGNIQQAENRFFVEGDPAAVLVTELRSDSKEELDNQVITLVEGFNKAELGYAFPVVEGADANRVWALRAAGLGLLSNVPGNAKPIACIEDTAVDVNDLPQYIDEFEQMMQDFEQQAVYYAHAGAGELHLRPIINLKDTEGRKKFRAICESSARLVKKYKGSLSGEHGDGRVRAEFIPMMVGEENYQRFIRVKQIWDPNNIFNPGKIVNALPIDQDLRYKEGQVDPVLDTFIDFSENEGLLQSAEKCNGSADCRKMTGAMCPSYQATKEEETTTRARANLIREMLTEHGSAELPLAQKELKKVLDLCVSCKACKRECPSNVDMALMKAEFLHQYNKKYGIDFKTTQVAMIHETNKMAMLAPGLVNFMFKNGFTSKLIKQVMGVAQERSLPLLNKMTFLRWIKKQDLKAKNEVGEVYLFVDEFTNFNELELGKKMVGLLLKLGYSINIENHEVSGRAMISKGILTRAKEVAKENVALFSKVITPNTPLLGVEPSAILSFRDEYPKLLRGQAQAEAKSLAKHCLTLEEFLHRESKKRDLRPYFTDEKRSIKMHVHCHQKALSRQELSAKVLSIPENYSCSVISSGCCGMAGAFGYEKEHYDVSVKMANLNLVPAIQKENKDTIIAASGTSCRHQIADLTQRTAQHPAEVLFNALKPEFG